MNYVLSRIAHFLYKVNVNYKQRLQGLKASHSRTVFLFFVNLHVYRLAENTIIARFTKTFIIYQFFVFVIVNCSLLRLKFRERDLPKCELNCQKNFMSAF